MNMVIDLIRAVGIKTLLTKKLVITEEDMIIV